MNPQWKEPLTSHARLLSGKVGLEAQAEAVLAAQAAVGAVVHQEEGRIVVVEREMDPILRVTMPPVPRRKRALGDKWQDQGVFPSGPRGQTPVVRPSDPGDQISSPVLPQTCDYRSPAPPPSDPGVQAPSPLLVQDPGSHLGVDEGVSIPNHTPGGHAHGHHLVAPSPGRLVVPHSHTHMPSNALVQPSGDNPGPYTATQTGGEVQRHTGVQRQRERD